MEISKKRYSSLLSRARAHVGARKVGFTNGMIAGGTGLALNLISQKALTKVAFIQEHKVVEPLIYLAAGIVGSGYLPPKFAAPVGHSAAGVGGFLMGEFLLGPDGPFAEHAPASTTPQASALIDPGAYAAAGLEPGNAAGVRPGDAAALINPGEAAGAFHRLGQGYVGTRPSDATSPSALTRASVRSADGVTYGDAGEAYSIES